MAIVDETSKIDEGQRLRFLEWLSNAKFKRTLESDNRYICLDPKLRDMVETLLKGFYKSGYKQTTWKDHGLFRVRNPAGFGDVIILSGNPTILQTGRVLQPGQIVRITNEDALTPPLNCIYVFDAVRTNSPETTSPETT